MYEMRNLCPGLEGGEKEEEEKKSNLSQKQLFGISFSTVRNCRKKKKRQSHQICSFVCLLLHLLKSQAFVDFLLWLSDSQ